MHHIAISLVVCILMLGSSLPFTHSKSFSRSVENLDLNSESPALAGKLVKQLPAPLQISPTGNVEFYHNPRTMTLAWKPVEGARSYAVQVQFCKGSSYYCTYFDLFVKKDIATTSYTFDFVGALPGQWRVWAVDINGEAGLQSGWRHFKFVN